MEPHSTPFQYPPFHQFYGSRKQCRLS
jgi:hypothetical protein